MLKISILVLAFLVVGVSSWTLEECEQLQPSYTVCYSTFERKYLAAITTMQECQATLDYITCMEEVGCDCNMTISYDHNSALTGIEHFYKDNGCNDMTGELEDKYGIVCDKWNLTINETHGAMIDMQFAAAEYILALDKNCSGIKACYATYDSEGGLAIYNRNMSETCFSLNRLVMCLDNAACACNGENSTDVLFQLLLEDYYYRESCGNVNVPGHELVPRVDIRCHANGTAKVRSICDAPDPTYKCYIKYESTLIEYGDSFEVLCPATKEYIECVEEVACECGLLVNQAVFFALTASIDYYNRSGCMAFSAPIEVTPGVNCPDGTGSKDIADRIAMSFSEHPYVELQEKWCKGVKRCYKNYDDSASVALFEKNNIQLCLLNRVFVECLELTFCECGVYNYDNTTYELALIREDHGYTCYTDAVLRDDFKCQYGHIGFKCTDDSDCLVVGNSECTDDKVCGCKSNTKYTPEEMVCKLTAVSGAPTLESKTLMYGIGLVSIMVVRKMLDE